MALVLFKSHEIMALIMCCSSLFDEDSVLNVGFEIFPNFGD